MTPYTLSVHQAENQLRKLIDRAQLTQQPVVLTKEGTAEPVAVLVESSVFELLQKREQQLFHLRLQDLQQQLDHVAKGWSDPHTHEQFVSEFQNSAQALWSICPERQRSHCVTLVMATRRLNPQHLSQEQIAALHNTLDLLRDEAIDEHATIACHQQLIACGLSPTMGGSNHLAQLYEEEL